MKMNLAVLFALTLGSASITQAATAVAVTGPSCESLFLSPTIKAKQEKERKLIAKLRRDAAVYFKTTLRLPPEDAANQLSLLNNQELSVVSPITVKELAINEAAAVQTVRNKIIKTFVTLAKSFGRTPSEGELAKALGLESTELSVLLNKDGLYDNIIAVKEAAQLQKPTAFTKVIDTNFFTPERHAKLVEAIVNRQRLIITTAVADTPLNKEFFATLLRAAKEMDAEILVFPANMQTSGMDFALYDTPGVHIITNSVTLTPNLNIENIKITAKQINPLMGLDRMGPRGQSQIVGSPKFEFKTVPTHDNQVEPHFLMTTGAITEPIYNGKAYIQERTNRIAAEDHVMGALILEKSTGSVNHALPGNPNVEGFYHFRHVEWSRKSKGFTDIRKFYSVDGVRNANIEILTLPDIHVGVTSPRFLVAVPSAIKRLKPKYLAIHDLFNGHTVSHHERKNLISAAKNFSLGRLNAEDELRSVVVFLNAILSLDPSLELHVIVSNHDLWLNRWVQEGQFMFETHNRDLGIELANVMRTGGNPLEYALLKYGLEYPKRVIFNEAGDSWKGTGGTENGQHGHAGANGATSSVLSMARASDRIVWGHTHTTQRKKHAVNIGTGTIIRQNYNREGASSWSNSFAATAEDGTIQVFVLNQDEWWAQSKVTPGQAFFSRDYPLVVPNNDPSVGQQVDQYSTWKDR